MKSIAARRNLHCGARRRRQEYHAASRFPIVESGIELKEFEMDWLQISSPAGVLAMLSGVCAFFYWLEKATWWRLFQYLPPVVFIYLVPIILANRHILPTKSPVYDAIQNLLLPMMLTLLLVNVNVKGAFRVMGRGIGVMLFGSLGIMVGAVVGLLAVRHWLGPGAWKAYGSLSASWTGGTGNLAAVSKMLDASGAETGLAVLADSVMYSLWIPVLLASKRFADSFAALHRRRAGSSRANESSSSGSAPRARRSNDTRLRVSDLHRASVDVAG